MEEISEFRPQGVMMNVTQPPFDDIRLRQAVNLAIDRWGYMQVVHENRARARPLFSARASGPCAPRKRSPPSPALPGERPRRRSGSRARALLTKAGFPDGMDVALTVRNAPDYRIQGEFLSGELAKVGIRTTLEVVERAALFPKVARLDYSIWGYWFGQTTNDPDDDVGLLLPHRRLPKLSRLLQPGGGSPVCSAVPGARPGGTGQSEPPTGGHHPGRPSLRTHRRPQADAGMVDPRSRVQGEPRHHPLHHLPRRAVVDLQAVAIFRAVR